MTKQKHPNLPRRNPRLLPDDERQKLRSEIVDIAGTMTAAVRFFSPDDPAGAGALANIALQFGVSKEVASQAMQAFTRAIYLGKSMPILNLLDADTRAQLEALGQ